MTTPPPGPPGPPDSPPGPSAVVAGHLCLDIIPALHDDQPIQPGRLALAGPARFSVGGAVGNTGLGLARLGIPSRLVAAVGEDRLAPIVRDLVDQDRVHPHLTTIPDASTSYSIVISPPGTDRGFIHCPGVNDLFDPDAVPDETLAGASLLHFGYPPVMRRTYEDGGERLAALLRRARRLKLTTTLDACGFGPASPAAAVDWPTLLRRVLPHVDCFVPSYDELAAMLGAPASDPPRTEQLQRMAEACLGYDCGIVVIKMGGDGLFAAVGGRVDRLEGMVPGWGEHAGGTLLEPCFEVQTVGTTGAGDAAIAGFIAGLLHAQPLPRALATAAATGACSVQHPDSTTGIPTFEQVAARASGGWARRPSRVALEKSKRP